MTAGINSQNAGITIIVAAAMEYTLVGYISLLNVAFWPITLALQSTRFEVVSFSYSSRICRGIFFYLAGRAFFVKWA